MQMTRRPTLSTNSLFSNRERERERERSLLLGCLLCIVGSTVIVLRAPQEKSLTSVQEIWLLAVQPAFLLYTASAMALAFFLILCCAPRFAQTNILVYLGICSVMSVKATGIAIKLTLEGSNQLVHFQTWIFIMVAISCIITQLNYLNMMYIFHCLQKVSWYIQGNGEPWKQKEEDGSPFNLVTVTRPDHFK